MTTTTSGRTRAQLWALAGTLGPAGIALGIGMLGYSSTVDDPCEGFGCASFGYAAISAAAGAVAGPVAVLGQLVTAAAGTAVRPLRAHPLLLGLLGAVLSWAVLAAMLFVVL